MESRKGRWKYLFRDFLLAWIYIGSSAVVARNIERYDTAYECEGKSLRIECQEGELINLIRANYGRFSITICNEHGNTDWSVNCMSPKSFRVLYNKCNQQQNCSIVASTSQFGDPCPNTLKYLEAHYQCVTAVTTTIASRPSPPWLQTSHPSLWSTSTAPVVIASTGRPFSRITTASIATVISPGSGVFSNIAPESISTSSRPSTANVWTAVQENEDAKGEKEEEDLQQPPVSQMNPNKPAAPTVPHETTLAKPQLPFTSTITPWKTNPRPTTGGDLGPVCLGQEKRKIQWNATRLGETAVMNCPGGASGLARWHCAGMDGADRNAAVWERGTPDLSGCRSVWLSTLEKRVREGDVILGISSELSLVTNNSRELYGGDMIITTNILCNMAERMAKNVRTYQDSRQREVSVAELLQGVVTTGSNLLDKVQSDSWRDLSHEEQIEFAKSLLLGLEESAFLLADTLTYEKNVVHERRNILMEVQVLDARNLRRDVLMFPWERGQQQQDPWARLEDRIELRKGALLDNVNKDDGFIRLVFMAFDRLEEILQPQMEFTLGTHAFNGRREPTSSSTSNRNLNIIEILNTKVISASLGKGKHVQLSDPVRLHFHHLITENVTNPRCVYWNYAIRKWLTDGCRMQNSNETHTICECDHLTNFAVLMDVHGTQLSEGHQMALQIITYIGCIISIVCLILAIITFQLFRGLKSDRTTIHKNLCVCLLIAEILFICGIGQTDVKVVCGIVAGLLHFFFLCAFAWMFLEGFQLYVMLIEVFEAEKSRLRWYYLVAYGAPLLVVAISCIIDPVSYGTDRYCWLRTDNYFILSFVGPVILVILANLVFLSMAIYMMCRHANTIVSMKSKEHSRLASVRAWLRGAIVLVFLLGLTWTFGLLYLNQESVVMAYIFTVLNSLQGLFIFVFHCMQNEKVRKEYRKFIRRNSWLPKCLRCSKGSGSNSAGSGASAGAGVGGSCGGSANGGGGSAPGKDLVSSHNSSSNPSAPTTDSSAFPPQANSNVGTVAAPRPPNHGLLTSSNSNLAINANLNNLSMLLAWLPQSHPLSAHQMHIMAPSNHNRHSPNQQGIQMPLLHQTSRVDHLCVPRFSNTSISTPPAL